MKVRWPTRCERCKKVYPTGTAMIRWHRRLWCKDCIAEHLRARQRAKVPA